MQGLVLHDFKARMANIHSMYRVLSISMFPFHRLSCLSTFFFFLVLFLFTKHCIQNRFIVFARQGRFCIPMIVTHVGCCLTTLSTNCAPSAVRCYRQSTTLLVSRPRPIYRPQNSLVVTIPHPLILSSTPPTGFRT